jgi:iron complex transport system substrate-binding protein
MGPRATFVRAALLLLPAVAGAFSLTDDDQNSIELAHPAQRIVSLAPGATAMLFAAGAGDRVVGTSAYSDEPPAAQKIERIGDARSVDLERILALRPDVVVVWTGGTSPNQIARLQQVGLRIYHHDVTRLDQIADSLRRLGVLTATEQPARAAADALATRIAALRARYRAGSSASATVLIQIWDRPIYTVGRDEILSDVIHLCGYRSAYEDLSDASPAVTIESVLARDPDIILALSSDQASGQDWLRQWQAFGSMKAVRNARVIAWSDPRLPAMGPGIVDAAEALCNKLRGS